MSKIELSNVQNTPLPPANLPEIGYLRLSQIIGHKGVTVEEATRNKERGKGPRTSRPGQQALIPVSRSTWYAGIRSGIYPKPTRLGRTAVWAASDIRKLVEQGGN